MERKASYQDNTLLAAAYVELKRPDQAVQVYKLVLQQVQDNAKLVQLLAKDVRETDNLDVMRAMTPMLEEAAEGISDDLQAAGTQAQLAYAYTRLGQLALAEVHAERGEMAQAREALRRGSDVLPKSGAETGVGDIQVAIKLALSARKLGFDDLAQPLVDRVPGMLAMLQGDAKGQTHAWLSASYLAHQLGNAAATREDFARAYQAMLTLPEGTGAGSRFRAAETRAALIVAMAQTAQTMADGKTTASR